MKKIRIFQVDAFTTERFLGNPAGVVPDADHLSDGEMQQIARELNNSETAFILAPDAEDHEVRIRFFTPTVEVPNCGHATVAAHFVRAGVLGKGAHHVIQKTGAGVLPVVVEEDKEGFRVVITQAKPEISEVLSDEYEQQLMNALGITAADRHPLCPVRIVSTGHGKVFIGLNSRDRLNHLQPDFSALIQLGKQIGCSGYFPFVLTDDPNSPYLSYGRMFAPAVGILEDPVTGNANGPLGVYLVHEGLCYQKGVKEFSFIARQGEAMGRPGEMTVMVSIENNQPECVRIAGRAVMVFETMMSF